MAGKLYGLTRFSRNFSTQPFRSKVGLIGVPYNEGTETKGKAYGLDIAPDLIRDGGLINEISKLNEHVDIKDFGNLAVDPNKTNFECGSPRNMHNYDHGFMNTMRRLSEKVSEIRKENRVCVTLGGDHSIAVGK